VIFHPDSIVRDGVNGDNWCITWADDGHQYTSQDDGRGWQEEKDYNNRVWRIKGSPDRSGEDPFTPEFLSNYPEYLYKGGWFGYGITSVDGVLYHFITRTTKDEWSVPFQGAKLIYSPDHGATWYRHDGEDAWKDRFSYAPETMFFWKEDEEWAFSQIAFVQCGKSNSSAKDDFVYLYAPNGKKPHELNLARVPRDKVLDRSSYRYFVKFDSGGSPVWSEKEDIRQRGAVHRFPEGWGLYSWDPSVVYNKSLDLFIMVNGGTERAGDTWMHDHTGSLGFYWSENPWGPWTEFYYTNDWYADSEKNLCYQPKLSPKWISDDGIDLILIFSDAQKNEQGVSHTVNYRWNQERFSLVLD
jgi:hypothetical protein